MVIRCQRHFCPLIDRPAFHPPFPTPGDDLVGLITLVLDNARVASESADLAACFELWERVGAQERWTPAWARLAMAAADNTSLCLQAYMDTLAG